MASQNRYFHNNQTLPISGLGAHWYEMWSVFVFYRHVNNEFGNVHSP